MSPLLRALVAVAAYLFVVSVGITATMSPNASAFVPAEFPPTAESDPKIVVDVSHTPTNPHPKQGEPVTYRMTFDFDDVVETGVSRTATITVYADNNAPFQSQPTASDFTWTGAGSPTMTRGACSTTSCTFTVTNLTGDGTYTFTKAATVASTLGPGTLILASASADIESQPSWGLENEAKALDGECSGIYEFDQEVTQSGAWLVDIKFGDEQGLGKVYLTPEEGPLLAYNDPQAGNNTISFEPPPGYQINGVTQTTASFTEYVLGRAVYREDDPVPPYYLHLDQGDYSDTRWLDSLNWNYDPSTWTGDTWLPAGTKIHVRRHVTYTACGPGGIRLDGDPNRSFGLSTQVARPTTNVSDSDFDVFAMPGTRPPARCENQLVASYNPWNTPTQIHYWQPGTSSSGSLRTTFQFQTDAIATSAEDDTKVFAMRYQSTTSSRVLTVYDSSPAPGGRTQWDVTSTGLATGAITGSAFDHLGNLWVGYNAGSTFYLTADQVQGVAAGTVTTVNWTRGPTLRNAAGTTSSSLADLAFDGDGNLYTHWGTTSGSARVARYDGIVARIGTPGEVTPSASATGTTAGMRGLAFVGNVLYAGGGDSGGGALYTINWQGNLGHTNVTSPTVGFPLQTSGGVSDLASCAFPKRNEPPPPPPGPAFKVQKSVVNPDGSIAPAGTTGATRPLNPDGSVTIDYLVTVTNHGNQQGTPANISDTLTLPPGFTTTGSNVEVRRLGETTVLRTGTVNPGSPVTVGFTIPGEPLHPTGGTTTNPIPISRTYVVTVRAQAPDLSAVNWNLAGTCNTTGAGVPRAGGFFNLVTMTGDSDGADNNDACAPISSAQLKLIKDIVDHNGTRLTGNTDAQHFTLTAAGPSPISVLSPTSGTVGTANPPRTLANAGGPRVIPGTYQLGEHGNDGGTTSGLYGQYQNWTCTNARTGAPAVSVAANRTITVSNGDDITCRVSNTKQPTVHVVKTATDPIVDPDTDEVVNPHIGQPITPAEDGTFTAEYTVTVTNTSTFPTSTATVVDRFTVPAGLQWGTGNATVTFNPGSTGATATGVPASVTQEQLASVSGATLATSVQNLPAGASVTLTISIPLRLDTTTAEGATQTNYELNRDDLAQCEPLSSAVDGNYTSTASGIPNVVSLAYEDLTYNSIPIEDNIACVTVAVPEDTTWSVAKFAGEPADEDESPHVGAPVEVGLDGQVIVSYVVVVTNEGDHAGTHPAIEDTLTPPTGFTIETIAVTPVPGPGVTYTGPGPAFTIPAGENELAVDAKAEYIVTVTLHAADLAAVDWEVVGECVITNGYATGGGGAFNSVELAVEDIDGADNNDACVPVLPPKTGITLVKKGVSDADGSEDTLAGAQFALYDTEPGAGVNPIVESLPTVGTDLGTFSIEDLTFGTTYWIVETKAPAGHALLPTPVEFTMSVENGEWVINAVGLDTPATLVQVADDELQITILDVLAGALPEAGSTGYLPYASIGLLLAGAGIWFTRRPAGQRAQSRPARL
ncbi:MAG: SpaA isopeptide-forming pilin-related protein [Actinomycetia bacterium]|nr:SpaA isopeptide-forming pilin-related protein [Actinomycetes bacterium]